MCNTGAAAGGRGAVQVSSQHGGAAAAVAGQTDAAACDASIRARLLLQRARRRVAHAAAAAAVRRRPGGVCTVPEGGDQVRIRIHKHVYHSHAVTSAFHDVMRRPHDSSVDDGRSFANVMLTAGADRYGAVHSPLFASILLIASPAKLPDDVTLSQFFPPGGGIFRPDNFPNVFLGAAGCTSAVRPALWIQPPSRLLS